MKGLFPYRKKSLRGSVTAFVFIVMITIFTMVIINGKILIIDGRKSLDEEIVNMVKDKEIDIEIEGLQGELNNIITLNNIKTKEELKEYLINHGFHKKMNGYNIGFNKEKEVFVFKFAKSQLIYDFEINNISRRIDFLLKSGENKEEDIT